MPSRGSVKVPYSISGFGHVSIDTRVSEELLGSVLDDDVLLPDDCVLLDNCALLDEDFEEIDSVDEPAESAELVALSLLLRMTSVVELAGVILVLGDSLDEETSLLDSCASLDEEMSLLDGCALLDEDIAELDSVSSMDELLGDCSASVPATVAEESLSSQATKNAGISARVKRRARFMFVNIRKLYADRCVFSIFMPDVPQFLQTGKASQTDSEAPRRGPRNIRCPHREDGAGRRGYGAPARRACLLCEGSPSG